MAHSATKTQLLEVKEDTATNYTKVFEDFLKDRGIHFVLGFSGSADDNNPLLRHVVQHLMSSAPSEELEESISAAKREYVAGIVREVLAPLQGYRIAVLTGGTAWGVPAVAAEVAKELGFVTIGVFPLTAMKKASNMLPDGLLDIAICVHPLIGESRWGDESAIYTKLLNAVVIIGGGAGTMVEVAHLLKQNEKADIPAKHLIPISGTGGTADKVSFFPGKPETMVRCVPNQAITSGSEACLYLKQVALLEDVYD